MEIKSIVGDLRIESYEASILYKALLTAVNLKVVNKIALYKPEGALLNLLSTELNMLRLLAKICNMNYEEDYKEMTIMVNKLSEEE